MGKNQQNHFLMLMTMTFKQLTQRAKMKALNDLVNQVIMDRVVLKLPEKKNTTKHLYMLVDGHITIIINN